MKHHVFVLQYYLSTFPTQETGKFPVQGNLEELNALLTKGWEIERYELLSLQGDVQNIMFQLRERQNAKSSKG